MPAQWTSAFVNHTSLDRMKLLYEQSSQCLRRDLDLFSLPPTQTATGGYQWVEHDAVSTITSSSPIESIVSGSGEDYVDLNNTLLEMKACIQTTNYSPVDVAAAVAPINNTLRIIFSQIDVALNDVNVSSATTTYPYRAYIKPTWIMEHTLKTKASSSDVLYRWQPDSLQSYTWLIFCKKYVTKGKTWDVYCKTYLRYDWSATVHVFKQSEYMLNGVIMKVRMNRSRLVCSHGQELLHPFPGKPCTSHVCIHPSFPVGHVL